MWLAEGQIRGLLAGRAGAVAETAAGSGQGQGRPGDECDDADGQDRDRQARSGGEGLSASLLASRGRREADPPSIP